MSNADKMRLIGEKVMNEVIPGVGFVLIVFEHETSGNANYVSSISSKQDIINALEEVVYKMKKENGGKAGP